MLKQHSKTTTKNIQSDITNIALMFLNQELKELGIKMGSAETHKELLDMAKKHRKLLDLYNSEVERKHEGHNPYRTNFELES
ncbi:hypothetical protein [Enterovibrio calviensis]|uniref:hypothetical protein n=1 Tax=Enterovibrio calviensis TaxID=91359 RepID=UPI0004844028|nr:hypothetical protein [Enterovibrio calviensis]